MISGGPPHPDSHGDRFMRAAGSRRHLAWLGAGAVMAFLVPFLLADRLALPRDFYYGVYAGAVAALIAGWLLDTGQRPRDLLHRNWRAGMILGGLFAFLGALIVVASEDAAAAPAIPMTVSNRVLGWSWGDGSG